MCKGNTSSNLIQQYGSKELNKGKKKSKGFKIRAILRIKFYNHKEIKTTDFVWWEGESSPEQQRKKLLILNGNRDKRENKQWRERWLKGKNKPPIIQTPAIM